MYLYICILIIMVEDFPKNHPTGRLPILDLEVWIEENHIRHQFYRKPMASRKLIQARSAFSTGKKQAILLEDGLRRLRNCSPELDWSVKVGFLNKFSSDLRFSGHTANFRRTILNRVLNKYRTDLANHVEGRKTMYRSREERENMKDNTRGSSQKDTWFRAGGATSTLTVPVTPGGILADRVRMNLTRGRQPEGTKTKVLEDGGTCTRNVLTKSNQFPREECSRTDCVLFFQRDRSKPSVQCVKRSVGYEGQCARCPTRFAYIGESSRTAYTRIREHLADYRAAAAAQLPALPAPQWQGQDGVKKKDVKSWMWEHCREHHEGYVGGDGGMSDYVFKVTGQFRKCLDRQIDEGLRITECESKGGRLLNSKNEYFTPKIVLPVFRQQ